MIDLVRSWFRRVWCRLTGKLTPEEEEEIYRRIEEHHRSQGRRL
jgi:hypothetical protein